MSQTITKAAKVPTPRPAISRARRPLSPAQIAVQPLAPIFAACKARGLSTDASSRDARAYAVNFYAASLPCDFITSFKDLLAMPWMIEVVSGAILDGVLAW